MQRNKGKVGERELAKELTRVLGIQFRRGRQFSGLEGKDVVAVSQRQLPGVHFEVKRCEALSLYAAMQQAIEDAKDEIPVVAHRRNDRPWLVIVRLDDLMNLALKIAESATACELDTEIKAITGSILRSDKDQRFDYDPERYM